MMRPRTLSNGNGPKLRLSIAAGGVSSSLSASTQQWPSGIWRWNH